MIFRQIECPDCSTGIVISNSVNMVLASDLCMVPCGPLSFCCVPFCSPGLLGTMLRALFGNSAQIQPQKATA